MVIWNFLLLIRSLIHILKQTEKIFLYDFSQTKTKNTLFPRAFIGYFDFVLESSRNVQT
jgi:hypothetical protein